MLKDILTTVTAIKVEQSSQGAMLDEILQRLRNKGVVLTHPADMPPLPLQNDSDVKEMERSLRSSGNAEYLVSIFIHLETLRSLIYHPYSNKCSFCFPGQKIIPGGWEHRARHGRQGFQKTHQEKSLECLQPPRPRSGGEI